MTFRKPRQMGRVAGRERGGVGKYSLGAKASVLGRAPRASPWLQTSAASLEGQRGLLPCCSPDQRSLQLVQCQGLSLRSSAACPSQDCSLPVTLLCSSAPSYPKVPGQRSVPRCLKCCVLPALCSQLWTTAMDAALDFP